MSINKLLDVEEHVWSPRYGLKGNIDATVQVLMKDTGDERTLTVPLEVKTGKNNSSVSHKAQTALYTLLLSDRYGRSRSPYLRSITDKPSRRPDRLRYPVLPRDLRDLSNSGCAARARGHDKAAQPARVLREGPR